MSEEWLTLQRAEAVYCVPVATWRRWIRERRIGYSRLGGRILIRRAEVEAWLDANFRPGTRQPNRNSKSHANSRVGVLHVDPESILASLVADRE